MAFYRNSSASVVFAKLVNPLLCIIIIAAMLYWGQEVLKPLSFSCLFTLLLISPCAFFERQGFPRGIAALITLLLALMIFLVVFYFISNSIVNLRSDLPQMVQNLNDLINQLEVWLQQKFHVSTQKIHDIVNSSTKDVLPNTSAVINSTFSAVTSLFFVGIVVFITTFLLLLYRGLVVLFFTKLFAEEYSERIYGVFQKIRFVIKNYIVGLFIEMGIVAIAYSGALIIIGVKYALLLGIIGAILNLIPYLGIFMACILSTLVTLTTNAPQKVIWVVIALLIIHLTDSNILLPRIVGSKVKLNALATILGVITGSALWGIPGMFMAVPIMAILKVVFEEVQPLEPFAVILGEDTTVAGRKPVLKEISRTMARRRASRSSKK